MLEYIIKKNEIVKDPLRRQKQVFFHAGGDNLPYAGYAVQVV